MGMMFVVLPCGWKFEKIMFVVQVEGKALVCHLQVENVPGRSRGGQIF